jgi:hypothetical protein
MKYGLYDTKDNEDFIFARVCAQIAEYAKEILDEGLNFKDNISLKMTPLEAIKRLENGD